MESFVTIAKYNSYSRASRELYLTQPALTNHINNLEKELMATLFERNGKNIELTKVGEVFYDYAVNMLKKRDEAIFTVNNMLEKFSGTLEIPYSTVPGEKIIPDIISKFSKKYPGIKYKLIHTDSQEVIDALNEKKYSFGFLGKKPNNDFDSVHLFNDDMCIICPQNFNFNSDIDIRDIVNIPLIVREEGSGSYSIIYSALKEYGFSHSDLNIISYAQDFNMILNLVEIGMGCAFYPKSFIENLASNRDIKVCSIKNIELDREFYFTVHKKAILNPIEKEFINFIKELYL